MCPLLLGTAGKKKNPQEIYKKNNTNTFTFSPRRISPPTPPAPGKVLLPAFMSPQPQYLMKPSSFFPEQEGSAAQCGSAEP